MNAKQAGDLSTQCKPSMEIDAERFPRLAALVADDPRGLLAQELREFRAQAAPRRRAPVAVALLQGRSREALAVMQGLTSDGVRIRVDRRHRDLIKADVKLVVNDNGSHAVLPVEFVRTDEHGRDIDLAYRFRDLNQDQQRLVDRLQASALSQ